MKQIELQDQKVEIGSHHQCALHLLIMICQRLGMEQQACRTLDQFHVKYELREVGE